MPHGAGGSTTGGSAPSLVRARASLESSAAASLGTARPHGMRRTRDASSSEAATPAQADVSQADHGGRPTRGVGVAVPGGTGAPNSLTVRVQFTRVAASWLAGVTGEAIHLQFPVTHRLERPG
jgi:hypothetical protein